MSLSPDTVETLFSLEDQVALVTGAGQGIGMAVARLFASAGARLVLVGKRGDHLEQLTREVRAAGGGGEALPIQCDIGAPDQVAAMVAQAEQNFGRIDILVNNAGITNQSRLDAMNVEEWDNILDANLRGSFLCTRAVFSGMKNRQHGVVINIASMSAETGVSANVPYASSKGGMIAFTKALARQMAPWGRANAIAPGLIDTLIGTRDPEEVLAISGQIPLGRVGTADEVASCALFLASRASSYMTGHTINVNGGAYMD